MIKLYEIDLDILNDLLGRIIDDYEGDKEFEQFEEDRLELSKAISYIKSQKNSIRQKLYDKYYGYVYLDGYVYIQFILENYDGGALEIVNLYEKLGRRFNKTASAIERAIRNFRTIAEEYDEKPSKTNKEFLMKNIIELCD